MRAKYNPKGPDTDTRNRIPDTAPAFRNPEPATVNRARNRYPVSRIRVRVTGGFRATG
jgi:hypothetical protein